jgi:cell division septation protein DedD
MEQTTAPKPESSTDARCPNCGEPAKADQLVCLRCGGRMALDYRRPPGWKLPAAIVAGVALVAVVAFGFGLREITHNARTEVADAGPAAPPPKKKPAAAKKQQPTAPKKKAAAQKPARKKPAVQKATRRAARPAGTWPAGKRGFTLILVSVDNRASAQSTARSIRGSGVPAGYLRSNDYRSLQKGFWYVYTGVYKTRAKAEKAVAKLGRGYPGAYVQLVSNAKGAKPQ